MKRAAVLGSPIKHSLSPLIHNAAYRLLGIDAAYDSCEVQVLDLKDFLGDRILDDEWIGFSLTMPLKEKVCEIAESLKIEVDSQASRIRSANTLYRSGNNWKATSSDVSGFSFLLRGEKFDSVTIFGAGGTARAAIEAIDAKIPITVVNRNAKREEELSQAFLDRKISFITWEKSAEAWSNDIAIVAVPINAISDLVESFSAPRLLIDALYSPWIPPLSRKQIEAGKRLMSGIDLLCAQALRQIGFMTGINFDEEELFIHLKKVAEEHLARN